MSSHNVIQRSPNSKRPQEHSSLHLNDGGSLPRNSQQRKEHRATPPYAKKSRTTMDSSVSPSIDSSMRTPYTKLCAVKCPHKQFDTSTPQTKSKPTIHEHQPENQDHPITFPLSLQYTQMRAALSCKTRIGKGEHANDTHNHQTMHTNLLANNQTINDTSKTTTTLSAAHRRTLSSTAAYKKTNKQTCIRPGTEVQPNINLATKTPTENTISQQSHIQPPPTCKVSLGKQQRKAVRLAMEGTSIFITGGAGVGKSFLLDYIIRALRTRGISTCTTASTGLAACHIGGMTLHKFAGVRDFNLSVKELVKSIRQNKHTSQRWRHTQTLVVDEISMVDGRVFDKLHAIAQAMRGSALPWGGIQLILCGDFLQLPPVWQSRSQRNEESISTSSLPSASSSSHLPYIHNSTTSHSTTSLRQPHYPNSQQSNNKSNTSTSSLARLPSTARDSSTSSLARLPSTARDSSTSSLARVPSTARDSSTSSLARVPSTARDSSTCSLARLPSMARDSSTSSLARLPSTARDSTTSSLARLPSTARDSSTSSLARLPHTGRGGGSQSGSTSSLADAAPTTPENEGTFAFEAASWSQSIHKYVELEEGYRQSDADFMRILNEVRENKCSQKSLSRLFNCCTASDMDALSEAYENKGIKATKLMARRDEVDALNARESERLNGPEYAFVSNDYKYYPDFNLDTYVPVRQKLILKNGSQVMLLKNINVQDGLSNGARGIVRKIMYSSKGELLPMVEFACGKTVFIEKHKFEVKAGDLTIASRSQLPLDLSWAFSIHKSQGMTLDAAAVSFSRIFECGQAYVALSRVRGLEGLAILGVSSIWELKSKIRANEKCIRFYERLRRNKRLRLDQSDDE